MKFDDLRELLRVKKFTAENNFGRGTTRPKEGVTPKESAVCIFIYPIEGELHISLMLRNTYNGTHSNQISLPGGKKEETDFSLKETAIRECVEEIGAKPEDIIGELTSIYIPPSNFNVTSFIGLSNKTPTFTIDSREVKEHIQVPLKQLLSMTIKHSEVIAGDTKINVPSYVYQHHVIWGATAYILSCFRQAINELSTKTSQSLKKT